MLSIYLPDISYGHEKYVSCNSLHQGGIKKKKYMAFSSTENHQLIPVLGRFCESHGKTDEKRNASKSAISFIYLGKLKYFTILN